MQSSVALTQDLVRFKTINPPGDERACAERLACLLEGAGFAVDLIPFGDGRAQLVACIGGAGRRLPIGFTGHLDTVPLGAQPWSVDPHAAEIVDGKLYGRGSSDMKSGVAAFIAASVALADKLAGTPGVVLLITAGEETGCTGAAALARAATPLPQVGALVVAEPTGNQALVGHKGAMARSNDKRRYRARLNAGERHQRGSQSGARRHSLAGFRFQFCAARRSRQPDAQHRHDPRRPEHQFGAGSRRHRHRHPHNPWTKPPENPRPVGALSRDDVNVGTLLDAESVWTSPDDPWIREIFRIARDVAGFDDEIAAAPYFTDASVLTPAIGAPPTAIIGPGELALAHQTDEFCFVSRIEQATEIYSRMIRSWCGI
jgi:succinyl-diaminopimelate desuccinylase